LGRVAELLLDQRDDLGRVGVGDDDQGGVRGDVPLAVVVAEVGLGYRVDRLLGADGDALTVERARGDVFEYVETGALAAGQTAAALFLDDLALGVDLLGQQRQTVEHVGEERHTLGQRVGLRVGQRELVGGLIEAGEGVLVSPELHAERLKERHDRTGREVLGAVEGEVFEVVRQPALPVGLVQ